MPERALSQFLIEDCRKRLVNERADILNRVRTARLDYESMDRAGGDEADQTMAVLAEHDFLSNQTRLLANLLEIDLALSRIDNGSYGVCEETEEIIEWERLRTIPWTRLSIEGAEIREATRRKFAR